MTAEGGSNAATIRQAFARESGAMAPFGEIKLNGRFKNASIMPETFIHARFLSQCSVSPMYTRPFASVMPSTVSSGLRNKDAMPRQEHQTTTCYFL